MPSDVDENHAAPHGFFRRYVFSTDHKVIAKQFLGLGLAFLAVGGFMAMLIRWQLARPGEPVPVVCTAATDSALRRDTGPPAAVPEADGWDWDS